MTEWRPEIVCIDRIEDHPNADRLSVAYIHGNYPCIVKRGEFHAGQLAAYIPVDSVVPDDARFAFLTPEKYIGHAIPDKYRTIKAKKIRGVFSMGLMFAAPDGFELGQSIVDHYALTKWEEDEEENVRDSTARAPVQAKRKPVGWDSPHYDVEGLRRYYDDFAALGLSVVISEKIHGANGAFTHDGTTLWVKSRNLYKKSNIEKQLDLDAKFGESAPKIQGADDYWWTAANAMDASQKLAQFPMLTFFGEVYGQVGGFPYDKSKVCPGFRAFDVFDHATNSFLGYDDFAQVCDNAGVPRVPVLYEGPLPSFDELKQLSVGLTTLGGKNIREGIVIRTRIEAMCKQQRAQFKLVSEDYLLQK